MSESTDTHSDRSGAWLRPLASGLVAGSVAVVALWLTRPDPPPPRLRPDGPRVAYSTAPTFGLRNGSATPPATLPTTGPIRVIEVPEPAFAADAGDALRQALDRPIDHFALKDVPAEQAFEQWSAAAGANISVDWPALQTVGVDPASRISMDLRGVPAGQIVRLLIDRLGVGGATAGLAYADGDVLRVEIADATDPRQQRRVVSRVYDVRPLLLGVDAWESRHAQPDGTRPADEEVVMGWMMWLQDSVAPDSWRDNGGVTGLMRYSWGWLYVRNTPEVQAVIAAFLDGLSRSGRPAATE